MLKKILLADDSITIQKVVELTFSEGDYEVVCVGSGAQAIRRVEEVVPDIALIDVMMPQRNGYEVCAHIKQDPNLSWIPVLLLTGTFEPFDVRRAEQVGSDGHITKPFESRALVQMVEDLIADHPRPAAGEAERAPIVPASAPETSEVVNAGQIFAAGTETGPEEAAPPREAERSPATVRIDSRAFFAQIAAGAGESETPQAPASLGPFDLGADSEEEPTHPVRASRPPAPGAPEPPPEAVPEAPPEVRAEEVRKILEQKIESIVRPIVQEAVERVLNEVAWEVIPEAAEAAVRRRIRELEEEAASGGTASLN